MAKWCYNNLTLNTYWFGVSFMWNGLHPIVLPVLLLSFVGEGHKNTVYGLLTFWGLILALITTPIAGALSDYTRHPLGRRRPWIIIGVGLCILWLLWLAWSPGIWAVTVGYLLLQISSNIAHGPAQGLIPDLVPPAHRGAVSGVKTLIDMVGVILAALIMGRLVGGETPHVWLAILTIAFVLLASTIPTVVGVREPPATSARSVPCPKIAAWVRHLLRVDWRSHREYARLLAARFLVLLSSFLIQSFALYYLRDVLQVRDPARAMGNLMAVIAVSVTMAAYPAGVLSERWGRRALSLLACAAATIGMALLCVTRNVASLWLLGSLIGLGMGAFASVNWAWATDLVPKTEAAKYLGWSNLATAGSAAVARLVGPVIDLINAWTPNNGYTAIFVLATLGVLGGLAVIWCMSEPCQEAAMKLPKPARLVVRLPWQSNDR